MEKGIRRLVGLLAGAGRGNAALYRELERCAGELGLPLEFTVGRYTYRVDGDGLWVTCGGDDRETIAPNEYLAALLTYLLEQIREISAANDALRKLIRRFVRRKATWAELKRAAE